MKHLIPILYTSIILSVALCSCDKSSNIISEEPNFNNIEQSFGDTLNTEPPTNISRSLDSPESSGQLTKKTTCKLMKKANLTTMIELSRPLVKEYMSINTIPKGREDLDSVMKKNQIYNQLGEIFEPLVTEGRRIQKQIIVQYKSEFANTPDSVNEDIIRLSKLNDAELANLYCGINSFISDAYCNHKLDFKILPPPAGDEEIDLEARWLECLTEAFGIKDIVGVVKNVQNIIKGTTALINATTIRQVAFALGKRYLGYIGLAYTLYQYVDCMTSYEN